MSRSSWHGSQAGAARPDGLALVGWQRLLSQPALTLVAEQVGGRAARDQVAMQDRLDLVLQPRALTDDVRAPGDLAAQRVRRVVRKPHAWQVVRGQQLGEHRGVDLVGLDLRLGDRPSLLRVGDHYPRDTRLEQLGDRVRVARRLQRDLVSRREAVGERPQPLRRSRHLPCLADPAVLPDRDLRELAVHIQSEAPARHSSPPQSSWTRWETGGQTTPTDSRSQRIRASRRGGQLLTQARSSSNKTGLPDHVCSQMPLSRTVAPYAPPDDTPRRHGQGGTAIFHTGQQCNRSRSRSAQTPAETDARTTDRSDRAGGDRRSRLPENLRRGHYELGVDVPVRARVAAAFSELLLAV